MEQSLEEMINSFPVDRRERIRSLAELLIKEDNKRIRIRNFHWRRGQMKIIPGLVLSIGVPTVLAILFFIAFGIGALLWPYSINTWLVYSGREPYVEWWMGGLMGLVPGIGQSHIVIAFVTFILMLFLGVAGG